jgi:hypothetical protein
MDCYEHSCKDSSFEDSLQTLIGKWRVRAIEAPLSTVEISGLEKIKPGLVVPFLTGKLLIHFVAQRPPLGSPARCIGRNLFAKRQVIMPRNDVRERIRNHPQAAQMIVTQIARPARRLLRAETVVFRG